MKFFRGRAFLNAASQNDVLAHLWIVVTEPTLEPPSVIIVNITSYKSDGRSLDPTCLLNPGDHPFVTHPSYVFYKQAKFVPIQHLEKLEHNGKISLYGELGGDTLKRVTEGFLASKHAENRFKDIIRPYVEEA